MKRILRLAVATVVLTALAYCGWRAFFVDARNAAAPPQYQGYVEGEFVQVSGPVAGRLTVLSVKRGDVVKADDLLFELESELETAALDAALADLAAAEAQLADLQTGKRPLEISAIEAQLDQARAIERDSALQLERDLELFRNNSIPKSQLDTSQANADANRARVRELEDNIAIAHLPDRENRIAAQAAAVRAADARVEQARWTVKQKRITSTRDGLVYDVVFRVGEWVPAGQPVVRLLPPENVKVRFFVPEPVLATLRVGLPVWIGRDGVDPVEAAITYISAEAEFTPPVIYSNESRYKLSFMIEARAAPEVSKTLNPGQPVFVVEAVR